MDGRKSKVSSTFDNSFDLLESLFLKGLQTDEAGKHSLLESIREEKPALAAELEALWQHCHTQNDAGLLDRFSSFSRQIWDKDQDTIPEIDPERYRNLEPLGQGGMGQVFKAEQKHPVARAVAIKVLPLYYLSPERKTRFANEQRALALIHHPHVAIVYDCGQTSHGQPYYVMEYLEPISITQYCDRHRLPISKRLGLFVQVCEGIGEAHRKGIIHRDINPQNILVSEIENDPVAKIIDFGIAKFQDLRSLQNPSETIIGTILGTPGYMSPEQARGASESAIDTLSDIYSLGALLYELLVGRPPFMAAATPTSLVTILKDLKNFVPRPPTHYLKSNDPLTLQAAQVRSSDPRSLKKMLKGDLDWIVMKALNTKPTARYETARAFAKDIVRFLEGKPVEAAPPGLFYRWRKLAAYHRRLVAGASLFLMLLFSALVIISLSLKNARQAEAEAKNALKKVEAVNAFTTDIFTEISPERSGRSVTGMELITKAEEKIPMRYAGQPDLEAAVRAMVAYAYRGLGFYDRSLENFRKVSAYQNQYLGLNHPNSLRTMTEIAFLLALQGKDEQARVYYRQAYEGLKSHFSEDHALTLRAASGLAMASANIGKVVEAEHFFQNTLAAQTRQFGSDFDDTLQTRNNYAYFLYSQGRNQLAEELWKENLSFMEKDPSSHKQLRLRTRHNLAMVLLDRKNFTEANKQYEAIWQDRVEELGPTHPETLSSLNNLAVTYTDQGFPKKAVTLLESEIRNNPLPNDPISLRLRHNLGNALMLCGETEKAKVILKKVEVERTEMLTAFHQETLRTRWTIGEIEEKEGLHLSARAIFEGVIRDALKHLGPTHRDTRLYKSEWHRRFKREKK